MRRKLPAAALLIVLACCLAAPASPQGGGGAKDRRIGSSQGKGAKPRRQPPGAGLGERLTASVAVKNFEFQPKTLTVKPGTVVTWKNEAGAHTVTADDDSFSSPTLSAGETFSHRFARRGTYRYHCTLHGSAGGHDMAGTVVVRP